MRAAHDPENSAPWFLKSDDGRSSIRITSGLSLTEDEEGEVILDPKQTPDSLVRFDVRGDDLWLSVVSPGWTLRGVGRQIGSRLRVEPQMVIRLPHNSYQFSTSLTARWTDGEVVLNLVRHSGVEAAAPVPVLHERAPPARAAARLPIAKAAKPARAPLGEQSVLRWLMPEKDTEPARDAPDEPAPLPPPPPQRSGRRFQTRSADTTTRSRRIMRRRRRQYRRHLNYLVSALVGIVVLLSASLANTPLQDHDLTRERLARAASEPAQPMLDEVEALLQQGRMNDQATLAFAVDAYRAAGLYGHRDDAQAARLAELERRLELAAQR